MLGLFTLPPQRDESAISIARIPPRETDGLLLSLQRLRNHPRRLMALRLLVGVTAAAAFTFAGPVLTTISRQRPGIVPVGMAIILAGLMNQRVRHWVIVTLCFTVALLALRDSFRLAALPSVLDNPVLHFLYPYAWISVAIMAAAAGWLESREPGNATGRRFYFATVSLYLTGHGLMQLLWFPSWDAVVLLGTGLVAGIAVIFADRMYPEESNDEQDNSAELETARLRKERVERHEWRDPDEAD